MTNPNDPAFPVPERRYPSGKDGLTVRERLAVAPFTEYEITCIAYRMNQDEPSIDEVVDGRYVVPAGIVAKRFAAARTLLADALIAQLNK
jgi:hypothetical protein